MANGHPNNVPVRGPYDFVPLSDAVLFDEGGQDISHDMPFEDGLSGSVRFRITAETPLLVGGSRTPPSNTAPGEVQIFRLPGSPGVPAIPGTTVRGLVRNAFEIMSFSKMAYMDERRFALRDLSGAVSGRYRKRMTDDTTSKEGYIPYSRAGYLTFVKDRWRIRPCKFARIHQDELPESCRWYARKQKPGAPKKYPGAPQKYLDLENARFVLGRQFHVALPKFHPMHGKTEKLYYAEAKLTADAGFNPVDGHLVVTGQPSDLKRREFVFHSPAQTFLDVPPGVMSSFLDVQRQLVGRNDEPESVTSWDYLRDAMARKAMPWIPVFWLGSDTQIDAIGLSMMFPLPYDATTTSLLPNDHKREGDMDMTEAVFGLVSKERGASLKGRVSFSACPIESRSKENPPGKAVIMSSPKPSFYPAYIEQRMEGDGLAAGRRHVTYDDRDARLSGWKRYPVRREASPQPIAPGLEAKFNIQTKLATIDKGATFVGTLRFHNLRPHELGGVLLALTLGLDGRLRHALGAGKPNGYGTVKIELLTDGWAENVESNALTRDPETGALTPVRPAPPGELVDTFVARMETFAKSKGIPGGWKGSDQIRTLFGLADPDVTEPVAGRRRDFTYLTLEEHRLTKGSEKKGLVPSVRRPLVPRSMRATQPVPATTPRGPVSAGRPAPPQSAPAGFAKGSRAIWEDEIVELLDDASPDDIKAGRKVRIRLPDDDVTSVNLRELKPVRR